MMNPEEFREHGRRVVDWIADYLEGVESYPVVSRVQPGDVRSALPDSAPSEGEPFESMLEDIERVILPGITHWQSPDFFAYFPANSSYASILGELLSAGLGVQGMLWSTSPACTELETHVLDWLVELLGLPERFASTSDGGGVIQDSASSASLCALLAARDRASGGRVRTDGVDGSMTAYTSAEAHSSIEKAMIIAGHGTDRLRRIETDHRLAMRPECLESTIAADVRSGHRPGFVCATVGTTSSGAVDPLRAIGEVCQRHGAWLHVDAAMAGTAALCDEFRWIHDGLELADSYAFNPHKWMFVNFDCNCFYVADRSALVRALSILPEYLRAGASHDPAGATQSGAAIDYRDWQVPLGRRFRALKLWFVLRSFGVEELQRRVREHVSLATEFAAWVDDDPDFELAAPRPLNLVCFRHRGGDDVNQRLMDELNASGEMFLTHTRIDGRMALRMAIGQTRTRREHVERAWKRIRETARGVV